MAGLQAAAACVLLACFLLASTASAGTLLGCYRVSRAQRHLPQPSLKACRRFCGVRKMPIFVYDWSKGCGCTATIPRGRLAASLCTSRQAKTAQFLYVHTVPGGSCYLNPKPLQPKHWNTDFEPTKVSYQSTNQVTLTSKGGAGPVLTMRGAPQKYGYFTIKIKAAGPMSGPVTAAYWTSDNSGTDRSSFDEIDIEIINSFHSVTTGGCLWTHHYKSGVSYLERMICPAEVQAITRLPYQPQPWTAARTYGLDWQPTYMRWYVDGRLVHSRDFKDSSQVPTKPMFMKLSAWSWNKQPDCTFFAGCTADQGAEYSSTFADALMVSCK